MNDHLKTKAELIQELESLRKSIAEETLSEHKQSDAALRESEEKYRLLYSSMDQGLALHKIITDAKGRPVDYIFVDINDSYTRLLGITREMSIGKRISEVMPEVEQYWIDIFGKVAQTGESCYYENFLKTTGKYYSTYSYCPKKDHFAVLVSDISERKEAENALYLSEQKFKKLVFDMQIGVLLQGPQAEIFLSNPKALELLGLNEDQLLGKTSFDPTWNVIHEDGSPFPGDTHPVPQAIASGKPVLNVIMGVFRPTTQDRVWLLVDAIPQFNNDDTVRQVVCTFIDMSQRKLAEDLLSRSENEYKSTLENLLSGVVVHASDSSIQYSNSEANRILGLTAEQMSGKIAIDPVWSFLNNDSTRLALDKYPVNKVISSGKPLTNYTIGINKPDQEFITWVNVNAIPTFNETLMLEKIIVNFVDITEHKHAEEALRLNESRLNILVEILQHDSDTIHELLDYALSHIISLTNSKIGYIYNYSEEKQEFTLNSWSKDVMNECTILEKQTVYQLNKTGLWGEAVRQRKPILVNDFQADNQLKKGYPAGHAYLNNFLTVPIIVNNNIVGVAGVANKETDYTETDILHISLILSSVWKIVDRKNAEIALRESEEKLSTLFETMTEMVVLHELVLNEKAEAVNYRITDCNNAFTKITGIKRENAIGKLATDVYQTESPPYLDEFANVAITRIPYEYASYYAPMDKHFSISVVSPQQNQFATITTDITALQQKQKVISDKNKELENFLYVSSHDLRTPLVNVQGFSHRLQKQIASINTLIGECSLDPEAEAKLKAIVEENIPKTLDYIFSNVTKMDTLINALLEISRTGRVKMTIKKININQLIDKIVASLNFQIAELSAQVKTPKMPDCYGDENLLNQLFTNIIVNAIKYRNPEIPLVIEIASETRYNKVIYSLKDNGMGIEPRHLEKIWDVFYRVDSASPEAGEGIGLSISKKIVSKHKGSIWASSEPGKGSVFSIELLTEEFSE